MTTDTSARLMPDLVNRRAKMHYVTALNELVRIGVDIARIHILAVGEFENYAGEIRRQTPAPGTELGPRTDISLEIGFSSAVDEMPHQFFHGFDGHAVGHDWEYKARCLMAPFDAAVIRHDSWALFRILQLSFGYLDRSQLEQFLGVFDVPLPEEHLSEKELLLLAMLMPAFNEWGGNAESVTDAIELFLGYCCDIEESIPGRYEIPADLHYRLGDTANRLGRATVLGRSFVECDSAYRLTVRGVEAAKIRDFLSGQPLRRKLEWFLKLVMPGHLEYEIRVRPRRKRLPLGGDRPSVLGYATFLSGR